MLAGLSPEERIAVHKAAAEEQKEYCLMNRGLRNFDYEDRMDILSWIYTRATKNNES